MLLIYLLLVICVPGHRCLTDETVCTSVDIRNKPVSFHKLEECTVIEGHLQILLMDNSTAQDFENLTFPLLREITDYLLFYRVSGLLSLAKLFPNLSVIRGRNLFSDFSLVVYEMMDLQELGLSNLTVIERGSVRVTKNPNLCFADTIDWDLIAKAGMSTSFIKENKLSELCPSCPATVKKSGQQCFQSSIGDSNRPLCWDTDTCQRICSPSCSKANLTCQIDSPNDCCHEQCLGGCTGPTNNDCMACKQIIHERACVTKCPKNLFEFMGRRCLTEAECLRIKEYHPDGKAHKLYRSPELPYNHQCLQECPYGYQDQNNWCVRCNGVCPKTCNGGKITNVADAQTFKGCTIIDGALEITVNKHVTNIAEELTKSLRYVQEIRQYLKIIRSNPLVTLHFFENLRVIGGDAMDRQDYSLLVLDNANLQELFLLNDTRQLEIRRGKLFFHMNPKLCMNQIEKLRNFGTIPSLGGKGFDDHDVSPNSNGDRMPCAYTNLNLTVKSTLQKGVMIEWLNFQKRLTDFRLLLGYFIHYRVA